MSEQQLNQQAQVSQNVAQAAQEAPAENVSEPEFTIEDVQQRYFTPSELEEASEYMSQVAKVCPPDELKANFDGENVKEGYGIGVYPIKKRSDVKGEGNVTIGIAICQMPDPDTIAALPEAKGIEFIRNSVIDKLFAKISQSYRPRANETEAERKKRETSVPVEIEAFMTSARGDGSLKTFTALAPDFVKALRKMGFRLMSPQMLRQVLSSKEFAEAQFPKIDQEKWVQLLERMINTAREQKLDPATLTHWKESRDERHVDEVEDINFDELDKLV